MSRDNDLPFPRGNTYFGIGAPSSSIITTTGDSSYEMEGREYVVDDVIYTQGSTYGQHRSCDKVVLRVVRNNAGFALLPKRLVRFKDGTFWGRRVDGYTRTTAEHGYPVDEYLPAAGVPDGDLFYIVVSGPATVLSDLASAASNQFAYGGDVIALTAATSGATTAGRVRAIDTSDQITSQATDLSTVRKVIRNVIGRAMTTQSVTSGTNVDILVRVNKFF